MENGDATFSVFLLQLSVLLLCNKHIAEGTVKNTVSEIIAKLQLKDRTQLAVFAIKNNLD